MSDKLIAITGVTGSQGGAAARHLLRSGWRVRGLTRNPGSSSAKRMAGAGVELLQGDMDDAAALDRLVEGVHGVYGVTDFFQNGLEREVAQGCRLADAAKRAGIAHFVFPSLALSERHTGVPYFEAKTKIEQHIVGLGLPATILRPAIFMEDLVDRKYAPPMWWGTFGRTVGLQKTIGWIAVEDVGEIVARVFGDPGKYVGQAISLVGDFKSMAEARDVFKRVLGKAPLAIPAPLWLIGSVVNADIVPMWVWLGKNPIDVDPGPARQILPEVQDMERWLRSRVAAASAP